MVLMAVSGCGRGGQSSNAPAGEKRLRFAVIPKALDIPVFNYAKIGAERKAKELGNVDILWNAPTNADQLKQKEDPRVLHHPARRRHRDLLAERRLPDRNHQPCG